MKNIKKLFKIILPLMLTFTVIFQTGCTSDIKTKKDSGEISIVATIFPPYDFAKHIAGDRANVKMLLPPGCESHSYEPSPADIIEVSECDVFIYNGGDSDAWVDDILSSIDTSSIEIIKMTDCVETIEEEVIEGMQENKRHHDHEHEDEHNDHEHEEEYDDPETDEHVWTSIRNSEKITSDICDAICRKDEKNVSVYKENSSEYIKQMSDLDEEYKKLVENAKRKKIIFGDRFPFAYFAKDYGLTYYAAFVGCSSETEASAETVAFLIDKVREDKIPVVFHIEFSTHLIADTIADETGAEVCELNSCHNVSKKQIENGVSYVDMMRENMKALKKALY